MVDCYWGWAHACLDQHQPDRAQDALENLIDRHPRQPVSSPPTFAWLEALYRRDRHARPLRPAPLVRRRHRTRTRQPSRGCRRPVGRPRRSPRTRGGNPRRFRRRVFPTRPLRRARRCSTSRRCACDSAAPPRAPRGALDTPAAVAADPARRAPAARGVAHGDRRARRPGLPRAKRQRARRRVSRRWPRASARAAGRGGRVQRRARLAARERLGPVHGAEKAFAARFPAQRAQSGISAGGRSRARRPGRRRATPPNATARRLACANFCANTPASPAPPKRASPWPNSPSSARARRCRRAGANSPRPTCAPSPTTTPPVRRHRRRTRPRRLPRHLAGGRAGAVARRRPRRRAGEEIPRRRAPIRRWPPRRA